MQINWSERSRGDLRDILLYVAEKFGQRTAKEVLAEVRDTIKLLKDFPYIGTSFVRDEGVGIEYFSFSSRQNKIVYFVEGEVVNIVAIWQNRQDVGRLIKELER